MFIKDALKILFILQAYYKFFLFFQSQYLLRFYLTIRFNRENGLNHLNGGNIKLRINVNEYNEKLMSLFDVSFQEILKKKVLETPRPRISENSILPKIKMTSMDILSRLINITVELHNIDEWIQNLDTTSELNREQWEKISMEMEQTKTSIDVCRDNLKTLTLIGNKFFRQHFSNTNDIDTSSDTIGNLPINMKHIENIEKLNAEEENNERFAHLKITVSLQTHMF